MFESVDLPSGLQSELARLRAEGRDRSVAELVDLVGACQSTINEATALQMLAMAHLAAIEDIELEDGTVAEQHRGLGHQRLDAPDLVSEQLGVSAHGASSRMTVAVDVVSRLSGVFEAMGQGRLDGYRAGIVSDELREASPEVCAAVVATINASLGAEAAAALRRRVRRALGAVDPDLVRTKAARARCDRSLHRWPGDEPGVDTWMGSFPVEQARSGWAVVDGLARQYVRDGKASGLEQARADALMDLIHARATGTFVVQLAVPADRVATPADPEPTPSDDDLVTVAGLGMPGTTQVRRTWLQTLARSASPGGGRGRTEAVACHGATGALMEVVSRLDRPARSSRGLTTESRAYRPPATLIDLVKARDGRCRFPGCSVGSRSCDVDHLRPWPVGPTRADNLMCLCRRHHRVKQTRRWHVRMGPDATVTWTDPTGRLRTTLPADFLQLHDSAQPSGSTLPVGPAGPVPEPVPTSISTAPGPVSRPPVDSPGVLWSAWEEELAHELARAGPRRGVRAAMVRTDERGGPGGPTPDHAERPAADDPPF